MKIGVPRQNYLNGDVSFMHYKAIMEQKLVKDVHVDVIPVMNKGGINVRKNSDEIGQNVLHFFVFSSALISNLKKQNSYCQFL
jgi:hypothetical protein